MQRSGGDSQADPKLERAIRLLERAYERQQAGDLEAAVRLYKASIDERPTAEAHTYLGWTYSNMGRFDDAIEQCKTAILVDPDFGNPYNDIGVYLLGLGRSAEAAPWLEEAIRSKRYCCYQFPHFNLGRLQLEEGRVEEAKRSFERALEHDPDYLPALEILELLRRREERIL